MAREYDLNPRRVPRVETAFRRIVTDFPVPESLPILEKLRAYEPVAMRGQPPVVWDRAEGFQVYDAWGNRWIDWSSGVLIANAGHGRREIADAIARQAQARLLTNYCFPSEIRARLVERLAGLLPEPLKKIFLLTTGSETVECAIKLCRTHGVRVGGRAKHVIVSYDKAFHGRTLGSQQAGGIPALKDWIVNLDPGFVQVPFPDGFRTADSIVRGLRSARCAKHNVEPRQRRRRDSGNLPGRQRGVRAGRIHAGAARSGAPATRRCWCATKCRPASAAPERSGASSITASFRTWRYSAKAYPVPCRLPRWPAAPT